MMVTKETQHILYTTSHIQMTNSLQHRFTVKLSHNFYRYLCALGLIITLALPTQAQNFSRVFEGSATVRESGDRFGNAVSISGNFAVIGAQEENHDASDGAGSFLAEAGAAYIFQKDGNNNWSFLQKITAPTRQAKAFFGSSVSISGNYLIVGAKSDNSNKGAAYVFKLDVNNNKWLHKSTLNASDGADADLFGFSVGITEVGYAVVGAYKKGGSTGGAYVYEKNASTGVWEEKQSISPSALITGDEFGFSVSIDKDRIVAGSPQSSGTGAAYVFERDGGGTWKETTNTLKPPVADQQSGDLMGYSVAIEGDWALVGAIGDDHADDAGGGAVFDNAGAVYVFKRDGAGVWQYNHKLVASQRADDDQFGYSVAISGVNVVVGVPQEDEDLYNQNPINNAGLAYIFHLDASSQWVPTKTIQAAETRNSTANFGWAVGIDGDHAIVGAPGASGSPGVDQGGLMYAFVNSPTFNAGLAFDGINNHVVLPNESNFDFSTELTIECWVKLINTLSTGETRAIVSKGDDAWELNLQEVTGNVRAAFVFYGSNGKNEVIATNVDFNDGKWHHVAITFDGRPDFGKKLNFYIDGTLDKNTTYSVNINANDDPVWIGGNVDISGAFLNGAIGDLRIWKTTRSATDIANFKNCQLAGIPPCLTAYYKFNEGLPNGDNSSITQAKDETGTNNGTLTNFSLSGIISNYIDADPANEGLVTCSAILPAKIEVTGNGNTISNGGSINPSNNTDVGPVPLGHNLNLVYTIKNSGTGTLDLTSVTPDNNDDFKLNALSVTSLAPGETTTFQVSFNTPPTSTGEKLSFITILTNDCNNSKFVFPLRVIVADFPEIDIQNSGSTSIANGGTLDLGAQAVNKTTTETVSIFNTATTATLTLKGNPTVSITGSSNFTVSNLPTSGSTVAPSSSTTFSISYTPTSVGVHTATLTIENDDFDEGTYTIKLTGEGAEPEIAVQDQFGIAKASGSTVNMGTYTLGVNALQQTLVIQNLGPVPLTLAEQPSITGTGFSITQELSNLVIPVEGSANIQVNFRPTSAGTFTGKLTILSNDSDEGTYTINLTGTAVAPTDPEIALLYNGKELISGNDTIYFDTTAALNVRSAEVYIKNQGQATLTLSGNPLVSVGGADASEFNVDLSTTASSIAGEDSTRVTVNFAPVSTTLGEKVAVITISSNDSDEATYTIVLKSVSVKPPSTPTDVNITPVTLPPTTTNATRNALSITWATPSDLSNVEGFKIKRSDGNTDNFQEIADITNLSATSYQDLNLVEGVQYYYRVFSYNRYGESEPGDLQSLVYVGTQAQQLTQQTKVFPNPASHQVQIDLPLRQASQIKLYSPTGQSLQTWTFAAGQTPIISVKHLVAGKYTLQITMGKVVIYKPLVKK